MNVHVLQRCFSPQLINEEREIRDDPAPEAAVGRISPRRPGWVGGGDGSGGQDEGVDVGVGGWAVVHQGAVAQSQ